MDGWIFIFEGAWKDKLASRFILTVLFQFSSKFNLHLLLDKGKREREREMKDGWSE